MYQTVTFSMFVDAFHAMDRSTQFCAYWLGNDPVGAYDALSVIFEHLEDAYDGEYELDVIGLCCDFAHDTAGEIANLYGLDICGDDSNRDDVIDDIVREYLQDQGVYVGETQYGFVYLQH